MTVILDTGGVSALATQRARLAEMRRRGEWPPLIPTVVLVEALTGDARRDFDENRLIRLCTLRDVDEMTARTAARLRTRTGRAATIAATDAVVAALALLTVHPVVITSDPGDIGALLLDHPGRVVVAGV